MPSLANSKSTKRRLQLLIGNNKTKKVVDALISLSDKVEDDELAKTIILVSRQYQEVMDDSLRSLDTSDTANSKINKLNDYILTLLDRIPEELFKYVKPDRKIDLNYAENDFEKMVNKTIMIVFLVLLIASVLGLFGSSIILFTREVETMAGAESKGASLGKFAPLLASIAGFIISILIYVIIIKPQRQQ